MRAIGVAVLAIGAFTMRRRLQIARAPPGPASARGWPRTIGVGGDVGAVCRAWRQTTRDGRLEAGPLSVWRRLGTDDVTTCTPIDGAWPSPDRFREMYDPAEPTTIPTTPFRPDDPDWCGPLAETLVIQRVPAGMSAVTCGRAKKRDRKAIWLDSAMVGSLTTIRPEEFLRVINHFNGPHAPGRFYSPVSLRYVWDVVCPYARNASDRWSPTTERICG